MFAFTCCQPARMGSRVHKHSNAHIDDCLIMLEYRKVFGIQQGCLKGKLMMIGNERREQLGFVLCRCNDAL